MTIFFPSHIKQYSNNRHLGKYQWAYQVDYSESVSLLYWRNNYASCFLLSRKNSMTWVLQQKLLLPDKKMSFWPLKWHVTAIAICHSIRYFPLLVLKTRNYFLQSILQMKYQILNMQVKISSFYRFHLVMCLATTYPKLFSISFHSASI